MGSVTELTTCMIPKSAAARVEAAPASGLKTWREPMGARRAGMARLWPRKVVAVSMLGDVAQDAGAEGEAVEGEAVAAHGGLGFGGADEVVPGSLGQVLSGALDDFFVAEELGCQGFSLLSF